MTTENTEVVLSADVQPYIQGIGQAEQSTASFMGVVDSATRSVDNLFKSAGRKMTIGGAGLLASAAAAGAAFGNLDSKMAQLQASTDLVSKTQGEYAGKMKGFEQAIKSQRDLFGTSADEAIRLSTALNKLGQQSQNMEKLTSSFTRLSAITGEGVGGLVDGMISLQRQMGTQGAKQTEQFNATLANLSINAGASAQGILEFSNAIAPAGRAAHMSQKEIMGVSTAFVKSGADGYLAANAFNKMLTDITRSIQYGSPELAAYSNLIGVSVDQFKEMGKADALTRIFEQISKQGDGAIKTLNRFGLDGVRAYRSIQAVAQQGGLRKEIETATGLSDTEGFKEAGDVAFEGLNDQMRKVSESTKQLGENLGKGVEPALSSIAKAIQGVLGPLNTMLQALGKIPGAATVISGVGLAAAGMVTSKALALMGAGPVLGGVRTLRQGYRSGRVPDLKDMSPAELVSYRNHQKWEQGLDAEGSGLQHQMYAFAQRRGERALEREMSGDVRSPLRRAWDRTRAGGDALGRGGIGILGTMMRAGLDPLSFRAAGNPFTGAAGSNFNRDQDMSFFKDASLSKSLGIDKVKETFRDMRTAMQGNVIAAKSESTARNTSINSHRTHSSALAAARSETLRFVGALAQAGVTLTATGLRGAGTMAGMGLRSAGRGALRLGGQALSGLSSLMGGPIGAIGLGASAGMWAWTQNKMAKEGIDTDLSNAENKSPQSAYAAALGEASAATLSFADAMKRARGEISPSGGTSEFSPTTTDEEARLARRDKSGFVYEGLKGADEEQATAIAASLLSTGTTGQKNALKGDLYKLFGTDAAGRKKVEGILRAAGRDDVDLTSLFSRISDTQGNRNPLNWFKGTDATREASIGTGDTIAQMTALSTDEGQAQIAVSSANALFESLSGRVLTKAQLNESVKGFVRAQLGREGTSKEVSEIAELWRNSREGDAPYDDERRLFQEGLVKIYGPLGSDFRRALMTEGVNRDITTVPRSARETPDEWLKVGIDQRVLDLMQGRDVTEMDGRKTKSQVPTALQSIFKGDPTSNQVSSAIARALENEENPNAIWTGMKALSDVAAGASTNLSSAIAALDRVKSSANDSSSSLYQLASQAQGLLRQRQQEEMRYMSRGERAGVALQNYQQSLITYRQFGYEESGQQLEQDRQILEQTRADARDYMTSIVTQRREFNVSLARSEYDFNLQKARSEEDYNRSRQRAFEDFSISRERAEYDYALQQKYQLEDYNRSRMHAQADFDRQRHRQEEDYQHQVVVMTRQAARTITNIYERLNVQRTWSAQNLLQNMADQQERLAEAQDNLSKLRNAGLSGDAIMQMGLNDPNNMQQLARLTEESLNNPEMIAAFNRAVSERTVAAELVVKDKDNEQWREMERNFKLNQQRSEEDFGISMDRQAENFDITIGRQRDAFTRQMRLGQEDFNRMMERQSEDFRIAHDRMYTDYSMAMARAAEDFNRQHEEITLGMGELAVKTLDILHGSAKDQMTTLLGNLGYSKGEILKLAEGIIVELDSLFVDLGISVGNKGLVKVAYNTKGSAPPSIGVPRGGKVAFAAGGEVEGNSPHKRADNIPAWLTAGEFVQPVDAVDYYGKDFHEAVRTLNFPKEAAQKFNTGGLVAFGRHLQRQGYAVGEHPAFGGVRGRHASTAQGGLHYIGGAIDVNADHFPGGEMSAIDRLVASKIARQLYGLRTTWRYPGHYDHAHFDVRQGPDRGNFHGATLGGGGTFDMEEMIMMMIKKEMTSVNNFGRFMANHNIKRLHQFGGDWLAKKILKLIMSKIDPYNDDYDEAPASSELKRLAKSMAAGRGWTGANWNAIDWIVQRESSWNPKAQNPTSTAYGLFQFLDQTWSGVGGRKTSDPKKQIEYGLKYIAQRYGTPVSAKAFWERNNWYGDGAVFSGPQQIGVGERGPEAVIPLNQRGVDFIHELMERYSSESKRTMVAANGVPHTVNSTNYYQKIDSGTHINGDIIVPANDPDTMIRKLQAMKRDEARKGRK